MFRVSFFVGNCEIVKLFQQGEIVPGENKDWDTIHTYYIVELFLCLDGPGSDACINT